MPFNFMAVVGSTSIVGSRPCSQILLGWKRIVVANTLAYCERKIVTAVKCFIVQTTDACTIKLFTDVIVSPLQ